MINLQNILSAVLLMVGLVLAAACTDAPEDVDAGAEGAAANGRALDNIGVQLYTVRSLLEEDFEGTLAEVAEIGYDQVEFAGYYGRSPERIRTLLDSLGLEAPAAHISYELVRDSLEAVLARAKTVGHEYVIVPSLPQEARASLDAYREVARVLDAAGMRAREEGIQLGYHNHAFEFEPIDGQIPYDILLQETDPENVVMEMDLGWMARAGQDPLAYFERYPGRFVLSHVKDVAEAGEMAEVGEGTVDFREIFARADEAGLEYFFVEHDRPENPLESIRTSYQYLEGLRF